MKINTKYFNEIELKDAKTITFAEGLPGFEDETEFVILNIAESQIINLLQSTKTPELAFVITNPHFFYGDYEFELNESIIGKLSIESAEQVGVYVIISLKEPFDTSTINLKAPIIINYDNLQAKQYILNDDKYLLQAKISQSPIDKVATGK